MINYDLARERGLSPETIAKIESLHKRRDELEKDKLDKKKLSRFDFFKLWTRNEYELQALWGFPEDAAYHRFWDSKGCTCPKMDNDDRYPTGQYIVNRLCPLHGINNV